MVVGQFINFLMKLSDYIVKFLENYGVKDIFMISGGMAMHLNDSFGKSKKITYYCNFHEQASAIAAEGYSKVTGKLGVCVVTAGPGASNTITGVVGQWQDSIPTLYISGQVRVEISSDGTGLRQLGEQELNIIPIVSSITKFAIKIKDPNTIRYHLEKAIYLATSGRQGPVWIEVPIDIQAAQIDEKKLKKFDRTIFETKKDHNLLKKNVSTTLELIRKSKRPVLLAGNGIRIAGAYKEFLKVIDLLGIPVLTASCANDLMYANHKLYFGNPGLIGDRVANFVIQNADLVLGIGSRFNFKTISFNYKSFAREAKIIVVDIDKKELDKKTIKPTLKIKADAKDFIQELNLQVKNQKLPKFDWWLGCCRDWVKKFPKLLEEYKKVGNKYINPYYFMSVLSTFFKERDIVITCNGITALTTFLMADLKKDQRLIANIGCGGLGYDLPAAIGACIANKKKPVTLTVGDGSIQFNIQELQTIVTYKLPIKIFIYNNKGYLSIRNTQKSFFKGNFVGSDNQTGVICPDMMKIAKAYGIPAIEITNHNDLKSKIKKVYDIKGPVICILNMAEFIEIIPKAGSKVLSGGKMVSKPMEDMYPYLSENELKENMIIKPIIY